MSAHSAIRNREEIKNEKVKTNKTLIDKKGPKVELSKQMMKSTNTNSQAGANKLSQIKDPKVRQQIETKKQRLRSSDKLDAQNFPLNNEDQEKSTLKIEAEKQMIPEEEKHEDFIFTQNEMTIIFKRLQLGRFKCPFCHQEQFSIGNHIKSLGCQIHELQIEKKQFDEQLESFKQGYRLAMNRKRKQKSRAKLLEEKGVEIIKAEMKEQK